MIMSKLKFLCRGVGRMVTLAGLLAICFSCRDDAVIKMDQSKSFVKFYGGIKDQEGMDIKQTPDEGFILLGSTTSFGNGGSDIYLIRVDQFGNEIWSDTYGGPADDKGR